MIAKNAYWKFLPEEAPSQRSARSVNSVPVSAKSIYRQLSKVEESIPIFSRAWWLDATAAPDGWDVALVLDKNQVVAAMPFTLRTRYFLKAIGQPALTHKLGPWIRQADCTPSQRLGIEKHVMLKLIEQLPAVDHFSQNWHYEITNWLPFSWNGFQQTTRYTYVLTDIKDLDKLWSNFQHNVRTECTKAKSRFKLRVLDDLPLDVFLALNRMTFRRRGMAVPYSDAFIRRVDEACSARNCRKFFIAVDPDGRPHSGLYIVWDEYSAYTLMAGSDPEVRHSGANSYCYWEAIKYSSGVTKRFDFAGSMMQPVERFLRGFGPTQMPYFNITKTPSMLVRTAYGLLSLATGKHVYDDHLSKEFFTK